MVAAGGPVVGFVIQVLKRELGHEGADDCACRGARWGRHGGCSGPLGSEGSRVEKSGGTGEASYESKIALMGRRQNRMLVPDFTETRRHDPGRATRTGSGAVGADRVGSFQMPWFWARPNFTYSPDESVREVR
jgi:hypothetical protein